MALVAYSDDSDLGSEDEWMEERVEKIMDKRREDGGNHIWRNGEKMETQEEEVEERDGDRERRINSNKQESITRTTENNDKERNSKSVSKNSFKNSENEVMTNSLQILENYQKKSLKNSEGENFKKSDQDFENSGNSSPNFKKSDLNFGKLSQNSGKSGQTFETSFQNFEKLDEHFGKPCGENYDDLDIFEVDEEVDDVPTVDTWRVTRQIWRERERKSGGNMMEGEMENGGKLVEGEIDLSEGEIGNGGKFVEREGESGDKMGGGEIENGGKVVPGEIKSGGKDGEIVGERKGEKREIEREGDSERLNKKQKKENREKERERGSKVLESFLPPSLLLLKKENKSKKVQFIQPSLSELMDSEDDNDDETAAPDQHTQRRPATSRGPHIRPQDSDTHTHAGTGLIAMLPSPKQLRTLLPHALSLTQSKISVKSVKKLQNRAKNPTFASKNALFASKNALLGDEDPVSGVGTASGKPKQGTQSGAAVAMKAHFGESARESDSEEEEELKAANGNTLTKTDFFSLSETPRTSHQKHLQEEQQMHSQMGRQTYIHPHPQQTTDVYTYTNAQDAYTHPQQTTNAHTYTHTQDAYSHPQDAYTHTQDAYSHSQDGNTYTHTQETYTHPDTHTCTQQQNQQEEEAMLIRLMGRRKNKRGGGFGSCEPIEIVDVSADDALLTRHEWMTKTLTEEKPTHGYGKRNREGMPSAKERQKHQITFLAHQAKERELELKNSWAQNRMTKMQTQAKYGF